MPIYGAIIIKKSRHTRYCGDCRGEITGPHIRLYGSAHRGDKPYNLYLHRNCMDAIAPDKSRTLSKSDLRQNAIIEEFDRREYGKKV